MNASGDHTMRKPGSEFVTGMKKTLVTPAATGSGSRSPAKGSPPKGGKRTEKESPSIPKQQLQQQPSSPIGKSLLSPTTSPMTRKQMDSLVDTVTDRVIDKLCRMDLKQELLAASPARRLIFRPDANDNQVPLVDLKRHSVVMITVTAKNPVPGAKMNLFRGTIHLNTNDIRLSEDVDQLMTDARTRSARKTAPAAADEQSALPAEAESETGNEELDLSDKETDSDTEKGANAVIGGSSATSSGVTSASGRSLGDHAADAENSASEADDPAMAQKSPRSLMQRDPRGRKIGSTISCKKLDSVATRFQDRVFQLKPVIESNGYDFSEHQLVDQTDIARITHGIDLIAFQRIMIFRRAKTEEDMMYAMDKGMIPEAGTAPLFAHAV